MATSKGRNKNNKLTIIISVGETKSFTLYTTMLKAISHVIEAPRHEKIIVLYRIGMINKEQTILFLNSNIPRFSKKYMGNIRPIPTLITSVHGHAL